MKRLFDFLFACFLSLLLWPVFILIAVFIKIYMGSPILFCQERPGIDGKGFLLFKFRTMTDERDRNGQPLPDAARLRRFGRFLRKTSLDEIPTLYNVIRGEMSMVGPRPLLMRYLPRYTRQQFRRHECRPGITGWAQVNGRNAISWEEKFELDVWYVDNRSLVLDLKILAMTVKTALAREGISAADHATMPEFYGTGDS